MPILTPKPLAQTCPLEDPAGDYRDSRRVEQYRLSGRAIYFPAFPGTKYLSFQALTKALTRNTSMPLTGCCGKALPVTRLRLYYDESFYQDFTFEKLSNANQVLDGIAALRPDLPMERETRTQSAI
ncbi:MAG: hypothetical protein HFG02_04830 [Oscillibacter sp.]|nr:hypothetical protein [Oscillibacter sp.]